MKLYDIVTLLNGELEGDGNILINNIGRIETALPDEITFISNPSYEKYFETTNAAAVLVNRSFNSSKYKRPADSGISIVRVNDPYLSFITLLDLFKAESELQEKGVHPTAVVSGTAVIDCDDISVGAGACIGDKVRIGKGSVIMPNVVVMSGAQIGDYCVIHPNVTIYNNCIIGNRVIIHSCSVIGSDGFGHAKTAEGTFKKIPHRGIVVIKDDVEIGSGCTIDRATIGETVVGYGVKLDNQIQIAHNVTIGDNTVIAAQTGIAGSTKIGKNCMIGGKVGIVGHIEICDNVIITAASNVSKSILSPGVYSGYRAQPQRDELKYEAALRELTRRRNRD
jgi:UDP-3-O-[3-hydroxymyristoyl] glucosamine N-acyltransferase